MFSVEAVAEAGARQVEQQVAEWAVVAEAAAVAAEVRERRAWEVVAPSALEGTRAGATRLPEALVRAMAT